MYNWGLAAQRDAYKAGDKQPSVAALDRALTQLKRTPEFVWLLEVSTVPLQQSLRDLGTAWSNFFGKRAKSPSFKKSARQAVDPLHPARLLRAWGARSASRR